LGSLLTAFIPGANLASVGTGAAGSTARFYADRQRGTKGAGLSYLLNLGMDATMAIPILGGMNKLAKVPKIISKTMPTIHLFMELVRELSIRFKKSHLVRNLQLEIWILL